MAADLTLHQFLVNTCLTQYEETLLKSEGCELPLLQQRAHEDEASLFSDLRDLNMKIGHVRKAIKTLKGISAPVTTLAAAPTTPAPPTTPSRNKRKREPPSSPSNDATNELLDRTKPPPGWKKKMDYGLLKGYRSPPPSG